MAVDDCYVLDFPRFADARGCLSFMEADRHVPFSIKRMSHLYEVPSELEQSACAYRTLQHVLVAMNGAFDVLVDDGQKKKRYHLNRPYHGLYVAPMTWRVLHNFSSGAVCVTIASEGDEVALSRYADFLALTQSDQKAPSARSIG